MIIERGWSEDIEVPDAWNAPGKVAKHRILLYWSDPEFYPCDEMGFRIPAGFSSFDEKYRKSENRMRIFCFGGSTTFGWYCDYEGSYPHHMETLLENTVVFNFGRGAVDSKGAMYAFLDLLRLKYVPDLAVFLDGINEKQGWLQAIKGNECFEDIDHQYESLSNLMRGKSKRSLSRYMRGLFCRLGNLTGDGDMEGVYNPFRFVTDQSQSYRKTNQAICKLAAAWNVEIRFFLQPVVWDILADRSDSRYEYIKALYRSIIVRTEGTVVDLSAAIPLEPGMFMDWQHLTGDGNKVLAKTICKEIRK